MKNRKPPFGGLLTCNTLWERILYRCNSDMPRSIYISQSISSRRSFTTFGALTRMFDNINQRYPTLRPRIKQVMSKWARMASGSTSSAPLRQGKKGSAYWAGLLQNNVFFVGFPQESIKRHMSLFDKGLNDFYGKKMRKL